MEAWIEAIVRVGTAPVVAMYLLYDYSKKLSAMQTQLARLIDDIGRQDDDNKTVVEKLDKLENIIRDKCK